MLGGFASLQGMSEADLVARAAAITRGVADQPSWAIEQACENIRTKGYLMRDRDGRERVERHWPPSDAEVRHEVLVVAGGRRAALESARALLDAPIEEEPRATAEERAAHVARSWPQASRIGGGELLDATTAERLAASRKARLAEHEESLLAQYDQAGVDRPVFKGTVVSLPMMLSLGWTIEETPGGRKLVEPPRRKAEPRETTTSEMGS